MMPRILAVVGTRPEAIKLAPLLLALRADPDAPEVHVFATGQHGALPARVLHEFGIEVDRTAEVIGHIDSLSRLSSVLLERIDRMIDTLQPTWVMAQGDTSSAMATALVSFLRKKRFAHIEAGLRTHRLDQPFPEEGNRRIADSLADLCCAPTEHCRAHLLAEGIPAERIAVTGNTIVDALQWHARSKPVIRNPRSPEVEAGAWRLLVTVHRRESWGQPLENIAAALRDICLTLGRSVALKVCLHPNPVASEPLRHALSDLKNVQLHPPLGYADMLAALAASDLVLTDSGGLQEEAPSFGVPLLILRSCTERMEGVELGMAKLLGTERSEILSQTLHLLQHPDELRQMRAQSNPYGDGRAALRIIAALRQRGAFADTEE